MKDLINRNKLPIKVGSYIQYSKDQKYYKVVGYYFSSNTFNDYINLYGYIIEGYKMGHNGGMFCYNQDGTILYSDKMDKQIILTEEIMAEIIKGFTKDLLAPGMIVEYKNGLRRMVVDINNSLYLMGIDGYCALINYNSDMENIHTPECTIMKVYNVLTLASLNTLTATTCCSLSLLWQRPDKIRFTKQEIADKLNIPVKLLVITD